MLATSSLFLVLRIFFGVCLHPCLLSPTSVALVMDLAPHGKHRCLWPRRWWDLLGPLHLQSPPCLFCFLPAQIGLGWGRGIVLAKMWKGYARLPTCRFSSLLSTAAKGEKCPSAFFFPELRLKPKAGVSPRFSLFQGGAKERRVDKGVWELNMCVCVCVCVCMTHLLWLVLFWSHPHTHTDPSVLPLCKLFTQDNALSVFLPLSPSFSTCASTLFASSSPLDNDRSAARVTFYVSASWWVCSASCGGLSLILLVLQATHTHTHTQSRDVWVCVRHYMNHLHNLKSYLPHKHFSTNSGGENYLFVDFVRMAPGRKQSQTLIC